MRNVVTTVWRATGTREEFSAPEPIVPDGCVEIIFNFGDPFTGEDGIPQPRVLIAGQMTRPVIALPTGHVDLLGVRFFTGRAGSVMRVPMCQLQDRLIDACAILPALHRLSDDLGNMADARRLAHLDSAFVTPPHDPRSDHIDHALALIEHTRGTMGINDVARRVGITRRHLERRFNDEVGLGAKQLSRIVRMQTALAELARRPNASGASIAAKCGYSDQAHLIRECRALAGYLPTQLAAPGDSLGPLLRSQP